MAIIINPIAIVQVTPVPGLGNYILIESDDGSPFTLSAEDYDGHWYFNVGVNVEYSYDTDTWTSWSDIGQYGAQPISSSPNGKLYLRGTNNTTFVTYNVCFLKGTQITLADGTTKNVENLTYSDRLKTWNFDNGCFDAADICWLTKPNLYNDHYYKLTFDDGTILKTTGQNSNHRVYDYDKQKFIGVRDVEIGDRVFSENRILTITNKEYINEKIEYYNVITSKQFDCFANGILTSDRYGNMYPIDSNMKFIKDGRVIRPYSDYSIFDIDYYWYEHLRLGEQDETVEKSVDYVHKLLSQMRSIQ